jgi:hypothetical protein
MSLSLIIYERRGHRINPLTAGDRLDHCLPTISICGSKALCWALAAFSVS